LVVLRVTPAVGRPGAGKPAGLNLERDENSEAQAAGNGDGRRAATGRVVAEVAVVAPAVGGPVARKPAGVSRCSGFIAARHDGAEDEAGRDGDRCWAIGIAPAVRRAVAGERTGMIGAGGERLRLEAE